MNQIFKPVINEMLQGLCYWMGYRNSIYSKHQIVECSCVDVAIDIIVARIDTATFIVEREVPYTVLGVQNSKNRADLAFKNKNTNQYECVLEFKTAGSNGGYKRDLKKMTDIKVCSPNIDCLSVVLKERSSRNFVKSLLSNDGHASRKRIIVSKNNSAVVRRVCSVAPAKTFNNLNQ